jgi:hypothetical protein
VEERGPVMNGLPASYDSNLTVASPVSIDDIGGDYDNK